MKGTLKEHLEELYERIVEVLNKSGLSEEDKQVIKDSYKEVAHQCSTINATFCAFEEKVVSEVGADKYADITKILMRSGLIEKKERRTISCLF